MYGGRGDLDDVGRRRGGAGRAGAAPDGELSDDGEW